MKGRLVDASLVVALVVVAGGIVWTLFSLGGGDPRPSGPDRAGGTSEVAGANGNDGIVPVAPGGEALPPGAPATELAGNGAPDDANGAAAAANDADAAPNAAATANQDGAATGDGPDRPDPEVAAADAPPLPSSGPVPLGRVGFSFVTGGAGACGIVLEAWTHVAVSRELLDAYGCGAEVTVTLDDPKDGRSSVQAVVADTMNPAFSRTANVYVGEDEPAFEYGLTAGTIQPR